MSDDNRKPLSILDRVAAPVDERAEAFATCVAYAGSYSAKADKVIFHIQASTIQNWVNTALTRTIVYRKNRMSLRTPPTVKGGVHQTIETTWEKLD